MAPWHIWITKTLFSHLEFSVLLLEMCSYTYHFWNICGKFKHRRRRQSFRFQRRAEIKPRSILSGKKFGQPWLLLIVQYLVCILTVAIFAWSCVRVRPKNFLSLSLFFFFFFHCSPMKIRQDRLRKMKKPVHFIGFKTIDNSWNDEKMRALALRRNVAEKPRGMRLKFVLSQLRLCTHESKNRFVFFKSFFNLVSRSHSGRGRSGYEIRGRLKRPFKVHVKNTEKN